MPSAENANGRSGKALRAPAAGMRTIAAALRRISGVELRPHEAEGVGGSPASQRAARPVDDEDVVALLDARRRQQDLSEHAKRDHRQRAEPRRETRRHVPMKISTVETTSSA